MKTWKVEMLVVTAILLAVNYFTHGVHLSIELVGSAAVLLTFGHAQIADRLAEAENQRARDAALSVYPSTEAKIKVECFRKLWWYYVGKESCWLVYFACTHAYSALVGVFVFLAYPVWRRIYRTWQETHPK